MEKATIKEADGLKKMSRLEEEVHRKLEDAGWNCRYEYEGILLTDGRRFVPDFTLFIGEMMVGYVECVSERSFLSPERLRLLVEAVEDGKNSLFILTDGRLYEVYLDGVCAGIMTTMLYASSFPKVRRLFRHDQLIKGDGQ